MAQPRPVARRTEPPAGHPVGRPSPNPVGRPSPDSVGRSTRRSLLVLPVLAPMLASCVDGLRTDRATGVISPGESEQSPSGTYVGRLVEDGDFLRPMILDSSDTVLWEDDLEHTTRQGPGLIWENSDDVLWILSTDHGNGKVTLEGGTWTKTMTSEGMPPEIAAFTD